MKITVRTTTCMTWSNFKDLQHNASWCKIQWNVTSATYNLYLLSNFCCNTCFFRDHWWRTICSNTVNTYSMGPVYSYPVQYSNKRVENIIGCYGIDHRHQSQELLSDKQSLINATIEYGLLCNPRNVRAFIERNQVTINAHKYCTALLHIPSNIIVKSCHYLGLQTKVTWQSTNFIPLLWEAK